MADVEVKAEVVAEVKASYIINGPDADGKYTATVTYNGVTDTCLVNANYKQQPGVFIIWFEKSKVYGGDFTRRSLCTKNLEGEFSIAGRQTSGGTAVAGTPKVASPKTEKAPAVNPVDFMTEEQKTEYNGYIAQLSEIKAAMVVIEDSVKPAIEAAIAKKKAEAESKKIDALVATLAGMPEELRAKILASLAK